MQSCRTPNAFQSTRPLRGGTASEHQTEQKAEFQSTRPLRGGTINLCRVKRQRDISIHPPLAGRDALDVVVVLLIGDFNPPAPCGAGLGGLLRESMARGFQSTRPLRGGTSIHASVARGQGISIHPPLAGRDLRRPICGTRFRNFNPPAPCGAGLDMYFRKYGYATFQSTRPLRGGTAILHKKTVQNIAYCTKSAFTLAVLSGFLALMRPFFCQTCTNFGANLPKNRCSLPVRTLIPSGPPPADSRH